MTYLHHQVIPHGLACKSGLRVGDRILEVNSTDLRHATHQEAVRALLANKQEIRMLVRRDPSPPGMQVRLSTWADLAMLAKNLTVPFLNKLQLCRYRKLWSRSSQGRNLASAFVEGQRVMQEILLTTQMKASSSLRLWNDRLWSIFNVFHIVREFER